MSINPGARGNEVSPLPRQMVLGIVNVIQAWQMTGIYDMSGEVFDSHGIGCRQVVQYGGTHSAALRSALLPFPASSLPRELVSGRHLPLPEAVGWPRPPYRTT